MTKSIGRSEARKLKKIVVLKRGHVCEMPNCGWTITIQIHHIDGSPENNTEENVILLCPSHHSLAHIEDVKHKLTIQFFKGLLYLKFGYSYK